MNARVALCGAGLGLVGATTSTVVLIVKPTYTAGAILAGSLATVALNWSDYRYAKSDADRDGGRAK